MNIALYVLLYTLCNVHSYMFPQSGATLYYTYVLTCFPIQERLDAAEEHKQRAMQMADTMEQQLKEMEKQLVEQAEFEEEQSQAIQALEVPSARHTRVGKEWNT